MNPTPHVTASYFFLPGEILHYKVCAFEDQTELNFINSPKILIMANAPQVTPYRHDDAWDKNWLKVDDTHELFYQQYGKKDGKPGR